MDFIIKIIWKNSNTSNTIKGHNLKSQSYAPILSMFCVSYQKFSVDIYYKSCFLYTRYDTLSLDVLNLVLSNHFVKSHPGPSKSFQEPHVLLCVKVPHPESPSILRTIYALGLIIFMKYTEDWGVKKLLPCLMVHIWKVTQ